MTGPKRIQRRRTKGWRAPDGVIYVGRGSKFGNPVSVADLHLRFPDFTPEQLRMTAVSVFDQWLAGSTEWVRDPERRQRLLDSLHELRGRDLMCWCNEGQPWCHGDLLLLLANK